MSQRAFHRVDPDLAIRAGLPRSLFTHTTTPRTLSLAASLGHLVKGWLVASSYPAAACARVAASCPAAARSSTG